MEPAVNVRRVLLQAGLWVASGRLLQVVEGGAVPRLDEPERRSLIDCAIRERLVPMLAEFSRHYHLDLGDVPERISAIYRLANAVLYQHLAPVLAVLRDSGIKPVLLKGADLGLNVYPENLPRFMLDVDLLIRPTDVALVESAFKLSGFVQGVVDKHLLTIEPPTPEEMAKLESDRQELCPFTKLVLVPELSQYAEVVEEFLSHCPFVVLGKDVFLAISYDVHLTLAVDFDVRDVWHELREINFPGDHPLYAQSFTDMFWYYATKMYHELMLLDERAMRYFVDTVAIVARRSEMIDWQRVVKVCDKYRFHPSLFFTLWHVSELLGPVVPPWVVEACRPQGIDSDRGHDWGDFVPKMLGELAISPMLVSKEGPDLGSSSLVGAAVHVRAISSE
jgi:hypothetical protein